MNNNEQLRIKAEQGDAIAQSMLAVMYAKGVEFDQDLKEAIKWYERAANNGNAQAQFELGLMYAKGQGVNQDHDQKLKWFLLSAESGFSDAQYQLSQHYLDQHNFYEAYKWISMACSKSSGETFKKYSESKESISHHLSTEQLNQATKEAKIIQSKIKS